MDQKPGKSEKKIGSKIKRARKEVGISQKELAKYLEISDKAISAYEVGRAAPSFEMVQRISKLVHKPIQYFSDDPEANLDVQVKLSRVEQELLEIKKLLSKR